MPKQTSRAAANVIFIHDVESGSRMEKCIDPQAAITARKVQKTAIGSIEISMTERRWYDPHQTTVPTKPT